MGHLLGSRGAGGSMWTGCHLPCLGFELELFADYWSLLGAGRNNLIVIWAFLLLLEIESGCNGTPFGCIRTEGSMLTGTDGLHLGLEELSVRIVDLVGCIELEGST